MEDIIFKQMIEDSPVPFFCSKIIRNNSEECIGLKLFKANKAFKKFFHVKDTNEFSNRTANISDKKGLKTWIDSLDKNSELKKFTINEHVEEINLRCRIEFYNAGGDYIYANIIKIDRSEMKLPKELREAPFVSWIKDLDGVYLDASIEYLRRLGLNYSDVIGKTDYDFMSKERADIYYLENMEVIRDNKVRRYRDIHEYKSMKGNYETIVWPFRYEKTDYLEGTIGVMIESRDETDAICKVVKDDKLYSDLINNLSDKLIIDDEKVDVDYISTDVTRVIDSSTVKWFDTKQVPIKDKDGNLSKKVYIVKDITEKKKTEIDIEMLRMDFFTNLSHELRTPINLILSTLQVLELKKGVELYGKDDYLKRHLKIIKQNGYRLLKLVNNIIDSTKLDSGSFYSYSPKNKDIVNCVEEICLSVIDFANANNIELIFDTDTEEKIISFDLDDMERIILNLLSNAIKYNKENGSILVNIDTKTEGFVKISVKDNGIGIADDKLNAIFNRFELARCKMENKREGSGIGLYLVKALVQIHNGEIDVKSKLGEGTEFIVTLPDVLNENEDLIQVEKCVGFKDIYQMEVEFSDIYVY